MKNIVLILIFIGIAALMYGQDAQNVTPQLPTSPQAESFKRYGEYSVNYSTGVPDISIPLYEINHRGYKLPLSLKYYPSPLKPGYNYDVFGHGWGLSINSCISRSIEFLPDEEENFKIEEPNLNLRDFTNSDPEHPLYTECFLEENYAPDKFNAILPDGSSFDFVIYYDYFNNIRVFTVSDGREVKITCSSSESNIYAFTVVDENGVKYSFDEGD